MARWQYLQHVKPLLDIVVPSQDASPAGESGVVRFVQVQYLPIAAPLLIIDDPTVKGQNRVPQATIVYRPRWTANQQFYAANLEPLPNTQADRWDPEYPAKVYGPPLKWKEFHAKSTEPILNPDLVERAWAPFYPDKIDRKYTHASRQQWLARFDHTTFTPALTYTWLHTQQPLIPRFLRRLGNNPFTGPITTEAPAADTNAPGGPSDSGTIWLRQVQYQAMISPLDTSPGTQPPFTGPFLLGNYPSLVIKDKGLPATYAPFYASAPIEHMTMEWIPKHPDRVWKRARRAQYAPYFGGFGIAAVSNTDAATKTPIITPIWSKQSRAWMPFIDSSPNPQVEIDRAAGAVQPLSWKGNYSDRIFRRQFRSADQLPFATGFTASILPIPELSWSAEYPDRVYRQSILQAAIQAFTRPLTDQGAAVPEHAWKSIYPDYINRRHFRADKQDEHFWTRFIDPVPDLSWSPAYPSKINIKTLHPSHYPQWSDVGRDAFPFVPYDLACYPDRVLRLSLQAARQMAYASGRADVQTELSWAPTYVDRVVRQIFHPIYQDSPEGIPQVTQLVTALSWKSVYPDAVKRFNLLTAQQMASAIGSYGTISIPTLSWQGSYPDRYRRLQTIGPDGQLYSTINLEPIPDPPLVDLSWHPTFDSEARGKKVHPSAVPSAWWNTDTPANIPFGWAAQHPFRIIRPIRPLGVHVSGSDLTVHAPEVWKAVYPDFINKRDIHWDHDITQAEPSYFLIDRYGWEAVYPEYIKKLPYHPHGKGNVSFSITPFIVSGRIDCIEFHDGKGTMATLTNETLTSPTHLNTSVTPTNNTNEDFC